MLWIESVMMLTVVLSEQSVLLLDFESTSYSQTAHEKVDVRLRSLKGEITGVLCRVPLWDLSYFSYL